MVVVFDFDGTLADTWEQTIGLVREIYPELNQDQIDYFRQNGARKTIAHLNLALVDIVKATLIIQKNQKEIINEARPFTGIKELLEKLREEKVVVGILSKNSKENINKWLDKWQVEVDFVETTSVMIGKEKMLKKLKTDIYVGDEVRDVEACKKVGVKIIAVSWGFNDKQTLIEAGADWVVERVEEILDIVKK